MTNDRSGPLNTSRLYPSHVICRAFTMLLFYYHRTLFVVIYTDFFPFFYRRSVTHVKSNTRLKRIGSFGTVGKIADFALTACRVCRAISSCPELRRLKFQKQTPPRTDSKARPNDCCQSTEECTVGLKKTILLERFSLLFGSAYDQRFLNCIPRRFREDYSKISRNLDAFFP